MRGPKRRAHALQQLAPALLVVALLAPAHAWVSVSDADVDRPSGSLARSHVILEESTQIGYYARSAALFPAKSLFVSGDMYVGRTGGSGTLYLAGSATISSPTTSPATDITLNPGTNGKVSVLGGGVQCATVQAPASSDLTLSAAADVTLSPASGIVRVVSGQIATLQAGAIRSGDPAGSATDLNLRSAGTGYIRLHSPTGGGAVRIGGTRSIEAMPDPASATARQDLFLSPAGDGRLVVGGTTPTVVVANVQAATTGDVSLSLSAAGNGDVNLLPSALGKVQIGGSRTIEAATQSGLAQDLILNPAGSGRVVINSQQSTLPPTIAAATSAANVDLNVNGAGDGDVVINAHGGAGRLVLGGSATVAAQWNQNFPNQDLTLAPGGTGRVVVGGAAPTITAAGTGSDQDLRINAGPAAAGGGAYGDIVVNGDVAQGKLLLGGARAIEGAAAGDLTLRPNSGAVRITGAAGTPNFRAVLQPESATAAADLVLAASGTGNVVINDAASTGSLILGGARTIEAQSGGSGALRDLRLNPAGAGKLLVGGSSTIEVDSTSSKDDLTLNPRNSGQIVVGGAIKSATEDLRLEAATTINMLSRVQLNSAYVNTAKASGYCLMGRSTSSASPCYGPTVDADAALKAVAAANVVTLEVGSAGTPQSLLFQCDGSLVGTVAYIWNKSPANFVTASGLASSTAFTQNAVVICSCVYSSASTYAVWCR